jgi:lipooligosaccharide transport system ATP-binding protein
MVNAENLTKKFDDLVAVDGVNFEIYMGESFGFLGPSGAGKTTTMRMIQSVSPITQGTLTIAEMNITKYSRKIKYMVLT